MNAATLAALLYLVPGTPHDLDGPDHEAGCYLGDYLGGETRVVYDGPPVAPFYVGAPGALVRDGTVPVAPGAHPDVEGVVVHAAAVYEVTRECAVPNLRALDPWASALVLNEGALFVFYEGDCDEDGLCRATSGGREFEMMPGTCEAERKPSKAPAGQLGWWVPATRGGVDGWVRGDAGFHVESRCYGGDATPPTPWRRR